MAVFYLWYFEELDASNAAYLEILFSFSFSFFFILKKMNLKWG